jgi:metal-sulfur cluster biosynthetic enzyme
MSVIDALKRLLGGRSAPDRPPAAAPADASHPDRPMPSEDDVRDALMAVMDPEAGMNIVDLGLVYGVELKSDGVYVTMTMTSPACPATGQVVDEARAAIRRIAPRNARVMVDVVWDPPWTPERMSEMARQTFGWSGGRGPA